jgi:imidazolonepropionase-like amidohydrolase
MMQVSDGKRHGVFAEAVIDLHLGGASVGDALASGTSAAADACGVGDRKGRLRAGYDADILVVDGDATTDLTALRSVATVFLRGQRAVPA